MDSIQKSPLDYVKLVFRRKWLIVIPMVIGLVGGIIAVNTLPKVYESSTLMLVEEGRVINPLIKGLAVSTSVAQRLTVLREQMLGWDRINQLISKLNLAKEVKNQQEFESLVMSLRKQIKVKLYGQNIIRISFQGENPAASMNIVKTITDIFIAENLRQQNQETENAITFINDQLALYQRKLKQSEIATMEDNLDKLLVDSTERHPMVIELKTKIAAAKTNLKEGNYDLEAAAPGEGGDERASLKDELKDLRAELTASTLNTERGGENRTKLTTNTNEKLYKMLLMERIEKVAARDTGVNQKLYNELLQRLETAKITQRLEASKDGTRYIILDPARLPLKPVKPNKLLVLLAGMFLGMGVGVAFVITVELFDHSFLTVEEAKTFLKAPILGTISKIVTQSDVKAQKIHNIKVTGISLLTGTILLAIIIFNVVLAN